MSRPSQEFVGLIPPKENRPRAAFFNGHSIHAILRDQFTITTWLSLGAVVQSLLILMVGRVAAVPALVLLMYRILNASAQSLGWKHNSYMDGVISKKFAAQIPNQDGHYGNTPANSDIVVFLIGTRYNHPMALLAPGVKELVGFFPEMVNDLEANAEEFGFLGMTSWLNSSDRGTGSEIMMVCYFRTTEGLHAFAHSPFHRKGWTWWTHNTKKYPHLSIFHETYHVPKGNWESIYVNSHASGINTTTFRVEDEMTGKDMWASPIVDASKGILNTSAGRMSRSTGHEHDKYDL